MRRVLLVCATAATMMIATPGSAQIPDFERLEGWEKDDHQAALAALLDACGQRSGDWAALCKLAEDAHGSDKIARAKAVVIGVPPALFTGQDGRMIVLLPIDCPIALLPEG